MTPGANVSAAFVLDGRFGFASSMSAADTDAAPGDDWPDDAGEYAQSNNAPRNIRSSIWWRFAGDLFWVRPGSESLRPVNSFPKRAQLKQPSVFRGRSRQLQR